MISEEKKELGLNPDRTSPLGPAGAGTYTEILYRECVSGTRYPGLSGKPGPAGGGYRYIGAKGEEEVERLQKLGWRRSPEEALSSWGAMGSARGGARKPGPPAEKPELPAESKKA